MMSVQLKNSAYFVGAYDPSLLPRHILTRDDRMQSGSPTTSRLRTVTSLPEMSRWPSPSSETRPLSKSSSSGSSHSLAPAPILM
jgi:hypothetical protein